MTQDWELVHMKICREEADQRKVKGGRKEREQTGLELQGRWFAEEASSTSSAKKKAFLKEVVAACSEKEKVKKRPTQKRSKAGPAERGKASEVD